MVPIHSLECKQIFFMVTIKLSCDQSEKYLEPVWKMKSAQKKFLVWIQVPEWQVISFLVTIAEID